MTAKMITGTGLQLLRRYDHKSESKWATLLDDDGLAYIRVFVSILRDIFKEETVECVLALIDEMLTGRAGPMAPKSLGPALLAANPKRARLFHEASLAAEDTYEPFLNGIPIAINSLTTLLKEPVVRSSFVLADGVKLVVPLISQASQQSIQDLFNAPSQLEAGLKDYIKKLSSFDKYKQEVVLGHLDWSSMHKDPLFWRDNISSFEENAFQIPRVLVTVSRALAVACCELSQFIQHHPARRIIVTDLKAKDRVMRLMNHENPEITKNALFCIQRLFFGANYASFCKFEEEPIHVLYFFCMKPYWYPTIIVLFF